MKGQVFTDFVVEFSSRRDMKVVYHVDIQTWKVFVDDASSAMGAVARIVIITLEGISRNILLGWGLGPLTTKLSMKPCWPD